MQKHWRKIEFVILTGHRWSSSVSMWMEQMEVMIILKIS